ncbi:hypothetical protein WN51_01771 [Melipona quadrifasciata]|uniref:Uncharacterized protein n=1 Tax=Melipona quadrifasciata TaxID=166423 RepID=A0A0M9A024_9HYME|nr:hypothetical protein WN51_01771 [Melipona quadrifasciata]
MTKPSKVCVDKRAWSKRHAAKRFPMVMDQVLAGFSCSARYFTSTVHPRR